MSKVPRVSVIIPARDEETYVRAAIESVLATGHSDLEILAIDDGSTDGTPRVLEKLSREHPGVVRVLFHTGRRNRGVSESRNLGIARATGELITFLDADDLMARWRFDRGVPRLRDEKSLDGVIDATDILLDNEEGAHRFKGRPSRFAFAEAVASDDVLRATLFDPRSHVLTPGILVRREIFQRSGVYDPDLRRSEDYHLWLRLASIGRFEVGETNRPVAYYRRHEANTWEPSLSDSLIDLPILGDVVGWAGGNPYVSRENRELLEEAYRKKLHHCIALLGKDDETRRIPRLLLGAMRVLPSLAVDRGTWGKVIRSFR